MTMFRNTKSRNEELRGVLPNNFSYKVFEKFIFCRAVGVMMVNYL